MPEKPARIGDLVDAAIDCHKLGDSAKAHEYLDELIRIADERKSFYSAVAAALTQTGDVERALEFLEKSVEVREVNNAFIRIDPDLRPRHDDKRFLAPLTRAGLKPPP